MRFLLSRPIADSEELAKKFVVKNIDYIIEPMMTLEYLLKIPIDFKHFQALIFTSSNAVRAFSHHYSTVALTVYCVGDKTTEMAKSAGFKDIISADGDLIKLSKVIEDNLIPQKGSLLYLSAKHIFGDLKTDLETAGFTVDRREIYEMVASRSFSKKAKNLLERGEIDYIPFYSSRSALIFTELINKAGVEKYLKNISALCLSPAIKDVIRNLKWQQILTAEKPTQYDLFQQINIEL